VITGSDAERVATLKALRGKIGRRGRLTIEFDTGELWWQWARLRSVQTPRGEEAKAILPVTLRWETASQQWYGIVESGDSWVVGDESFYLGDGSASLGMNDYSYEIAAGSTLISPTLAHGGNTFARNMHIQLQTDEAMTSMTIESGQGQSISWANPGLSGAFTLTIDTGAKACFARMDNEGVAILQARGQGADVLVQTTSAHGLATGDSVEISGTTAYNGVHHDITVVGAALFTYPIAENIANQFALETTGMVYPIVDGWNTLTVFDRKNWFMLYPGDNDLSIAHFTDGSTPLQAYTIRFSWYDHFK